MEPSSSHLPAIANASRITAEVGGVEIDNSYVTKPAKVKILKIDREKNCSRIEITIHEKRLSVKIHQNYVKE